MTRGGSRIVGSSPAVQRAAQVRSRQPLQQSRIIRPPIPLYHDQLLASAVRFRTDGENEIAVILAQTACEVAGERTFRRSFS